MIIKKIKLLPCIFLAALLSSTSAMAAEHLVAVPLSDGWLSTSALRSAMVRDVGVPPALLDCISSVDVGIDLNGLNGSVLVHAMNDALGDGLHLAVTRDAFTISFDPQMLPADWNASCDALRRFTQTIAPAASERQQQRYGFHLPEVVNPDAPLVILIHGLDGDAGTCVDLAGLMKADGYQTATFAYPADQPLDESAALFASHMKALHDVFPNLRIDLVTESMGGLIARRYVEGPQYAGGVDRFILIAPPNEGSTWTHASLLLKLAVNTFRWRHDPDWSPAWMITEGLCQAAGDLRPQSEFLRELGALPRRQGVRYTIIAGDRPIFRRYEANMLALADGAIVSSVAHVWGFRQLKQAVESKHQRVLEKQGDNDGPVTLASARLAGVDDFVTVHSDHIALYQTIGGQPPAAYPVIHDRLENR
jgi:pimeloyl-ACP methyl ester carboxylesterase